MYAVYYQGYSKENSTEPDEVGVLGVLKWVKAIISHKISQKKVKIGQVE